MTTEATRRPRPPITVMMMGLRGFPNVQGGVETHVEHLSRELVALGCQVEVLTRSPYQPHDVGSTWQGIKFTRIWSPKTKSLEAIVHSLLCVIWASFRRPDILHIHAVGPALVTPLARLAGLRVVVTHHGPDYERQKWGWFAKSALQAGEWLGMRLANLRIVISPVIEALVRQKHHVSSLVIPNGVVLPDMPTSTDTLSKFGLTPGRYVILVSRLVPEKRHLHLVEAFKQAEVPGWKLVIVGGSDHPDAYTAAVERAVNSCPNGVLTGFQSGKALQELYANAGLFVLPSSHEGLPIALLEALSYNLRVIVSDIPANLSVGLPAEHYFPVDDIAALTCTLKQAMLTPAVQQRNWRSWLTERFDWASIGNATYLAYQQLLGLTPSRTP